MSKLIAAAKPTGAAMMAYSGQRIRAVRHLHDQGRLHYRWTGLVIAISLPGEPIPSWQAMAAWGRRAEPYGKAAIEAVHGTEQVVRVPPVVR